MRVLPTRWTVAAVLALLLVVGCVPNEGTPPAPRSPTPVSEVDTRTPSAVPSPTGAEPSGSTTRPTEPSPSLPTVFDVATPLIDGGAATVVAKLHELSGLRPALKLDISEEEVTLVVLDRNRTARGYRWRDGVITAAETDVQYLGQTIFWPTSFALDNLRLIFDNAALLGTSTSGQNLQVVEYRPGKVLMSVTTTPESDTIFFHPDGSVFRSLDTTSVADIRQGIAAVTEGTSQVYSIGFNSQLGYWSELPVGDDTTERRARMANRPTFVSQRTGASSLETFNPDMVDPAALAQTIASHSGEGGCAVEIDNRFGRVQPVVVYQCGGETYYSDLQGRDLTAQLG